MIKTLVCKKCTKSIKIDFDKAPANVFTVACPHCSQKYKLSKPKIDEKNNSESLNTKVNINIKNTPCPKCKTNLAIDFSKISKFPALATCKNCSTKIRINDPNLKSALTNNELDKLKKEKSQVNFDKSKIDPKNNWAYKLYYFTKWIPYVSKATLLLYLSYLIRSISKDLAKMKLESINLETFAKLKAEVSVLSSNIFNSIVNPILKENNISPKLISWATNWFIKKISIRIILGILIHNNVDQSLPFIKKFMDESQKETSKIVRFFTSIYAIIIYYLLLIFIPLKFYFYFDLTESILLGLIFAYLPWLIASRKNYTFTKSVYFGYMLFWLVVILTPQYSSSSFMYNLIDAFRSIANYFQYAFVILATTSLLIDLLRRNGKSISLIEKINVIFSHKVVFGLFIVPFIIFLSYLTFTRHKISEEEWSAIREQNQKINGYWYFINQDSTEVGYFYINSNSNQLGESGDLEITYSLSTDSYSIPNLSKNESSLKIETDYKYKLTYPINFEGLLEINLNQDSTLKCVFSLQDGSKFNFSATRSKESLESVITQRKNQLDNAMLNDIEYAQEGNLIVLADKAYFHAEADEFYRTEAYLVKGQSVYYTQFLNGFFYVSFENDSGIVTNGWIKVSDIQVQ